MPNIPNLDKANPELVDKLRLAIIECCQDYKRKVNKGCKLCPYKQICDKHDELFWALDELLETDNSGD